MEKRISKWSDNSRDDFDEFDDPSEHLWEEEEEEEEDGEEEEDDEDETDVSKFTQETFDRAVSKARKSARSAATKKLLEDLGVATPAEAKALLQTAREKAEKDGDSDSEAAAELQRLKAENAQIKAEALKREVTGRVKDALVDAGLSVKAAAKAVRLVEIEEDDPSEEEVQDAIVELRETMPQLFVTASNDEDDEENETKPGTKAGTQPPKPKRKRQGASAADQAAEIFARRHPQTANSK